MPTNDSRTNQLGNIQRVAMAAKLPPLPPMDSTMNRDDFMAFFLVLDKPRKKSAALELTPHRGIQHHTGGQHGHHRSAVGGAGEGL